MDLNKTTLSEQIYQILKEDILTQRIPLGEKLTLKMLKERFEARGGGKEEMVQGYVSALRKDIEGALYSL